MDAVYVVREVDYDSGIVLGAYTNRGVAETAMRAFAYMRNGEEVEHAKWAAENMTEPDGSPYQKELLPFAETIGDDGHLRFESEMGILHVMELALNEPCQYPWRKQAAASTAQEGG